MIGRRVFHAAPLLLALVSCGRDGPALGKSVERSLLIRPGSFELYRGQRFGFDVLLVEGGLEKSVLSEAETSLEPAKIVELQGLGAGIARAAGEAKLLAKHGPLSASADITVHAAELTGISVKPERFTLATGESRPLEVEGTLSDGSRVDLTPGATGTTYRSSGARFASVDANGSVLALAPGEVEITVTHGRFSATANLTITGEPPKGFVSLRLDPDVLALGFGQSALLRAIGKTEDGTEHDLVREGFEVSFGSSDNNLLVVSPMGSVQARNSEGSVTVTAKHRELSATAKVDIKREVERRLTSITIVPETATLNVGETLQLQVLGNYSDGTQADLTRGSGTTYRPTPANGPATVGQTTGLVRGARPGNSVITATNSGFTAQTRIRVLEADVTLTELIVEPAQVSIPVGETRELTVTAVFSDGSRTNVTSSPSTTYSVSPIDVATVNAGRVTGRRPGRAEVRITYGGITRSVEVVVTDQPVTVVGLRFVPDPIRVAVGSSVPFQVIAQYSDGSTRDVTGSRGLALRILDTSVAALSGIGGIQGQAAGDTFIEANFQNASARARIVVEGGPVGYVALILVVPNTIDVGSTEAWQVGGVRSDGQIDDLTHDPRLQISVSSSNVIAVRPGEVEGLRVGVSDLTVRMLGLSATRSVRVIATVDPVVRIEFVPASITMDVGDQVIVQLFAIYQSGARRDITYDPGVNGSATGPVDLLPDPNGVIVVALGAGRAQIDVTYQNLSASLPITIRGANPTLTSLEVVAPTSMNVGNVVAYQVIAHYSDGSVEDVTFDPNVVVRVSPPGVASLLGAGAIRGDSPGTAMVEAVLGGFQANAFIRVLPASFVALFWVPSALTLQVAESATAELFGRRADGSTSRISPSGVDALSASGPIAVSVGPTSFIISGSGVGTGELRASMDGLEAVLPVNVTPGPAQVTGIRGEPNPMNLTILGIGRITVIATYSDGREGPVTGATFVSANGMVANVDPSGTVIGFSPGTTTIQISYSGFNATVTVNVGATPLRLIVTPDPVDVDVGSVVALSVSVQLSDGTTQPATGATFSSDDPSVASVGPLGGVRGVTAGQTFVTVSAMGLSARIGVTVHAVPPPVLTRLDPDAIAVGSPATTVRALGSDFRAGDRIIFDGGVLTATFVSANELTFRLTATQLRTVANHRVQVERPTTAQRSVVRTLRVGEPPNISELNPAAMREGTTEDLEAVGSGLTGLTITSNSPVISICCAAESGTSVQFRVTAPASSAGSYTLTFTNDFGSTTVTLTVLAGPADLVVSAGQTVHLSGANTYHDVRVEAGGTIIGDGFTPLHLFAEGTITIRGMIDVSGSDGQDGFRGPAGGGDAGPGGGGGGGGADGNTNSPAAGGQGAPNGGSAAIGAGAGTAAGDGGGLGAGEGAAGGCGQGGGGGAFGGNGGAGGGDAGDGRGAPGGTASGGSTFAGGTGGGGGSTCSNSSGGGGGGGGGVLVLETAGGQISVVGIVRANGGKGGDGFGNTGGAGGGAGGRVQLAAPGGVVSVSGTVEAVGGGGGNSFDGDAGGGGGGGQIVISAGTRNLTGVIDVAGGNGGLAIRNGNSGRPGASGVTP
ncbi:MAG: Ig-like domain-containing protein [Deltaproteobacteria bacterium]|nr:Ig-like domain-containing protein [Deltaproteobacteria bacterium]